MLEQQEMKKKPGAMLNLGEQFCIEKKNLWQIFPREIK